MSGIGSLTIGAARLMDGGGVKQTMVAMEEASVFVMSISDGSLLGVQADADSDMSVVAYHMGMFVGRAGHVLTPNSAANCASRWRAPSDVRPQTSGARREPPPRPRTPVLPHRRPHPLRPCAARRDLRRGAGGPAERRQLPQGALSSRVMPELQAIVELCRRMRTVAEISAILKMPLGVVRVLLSDLADQGKIRVYGTGHGPGRPERALLERVLSGLRRL